MARSSSLCAPTPVDSYTPSVFPSAYDGSIGYTSVEQFRRPMNFTITRHALFVVLLAAVGCSAPPKAENTAPPAPKQPDLTFQVASLNLVNFNKLFEKKDVDKLARLLKKEQIDIFTVQGITRYPGVERHVDFVNELVSRSDMRQVFGEMFNNAGRQSGNGIFSTYPLRNNHNEPFDGVKSALFEAALETSVDGGVKDIVVVSALLPPKATTSDRSKCLKIIAEKNVAGSGLPMILTGNLPPDEALRTSGHYLGVGESNGSGKEKKIPTTIWFTDDGSLKLLGARTVESDFGPMVVAQFGLFR